MKYLKRFNENIESLSFKDFFNDYIDRYDSMKQGFTSTKLDDHYEELISKIEGLLDSPDKSLEYIKTLQGDDRLKALLIVIYSAPDITEYHGKLVDFKNEIETIKRYNKKPIKEAKVFKMNTKPSKQQLFKFLEENGFTKHEPYKDSKDWASPQIIVFKKKKGRKDIIISFPMGKLKDQHYANARHTLIYNDIISDEEAFDNIFNGVGDNRKRLSDKITQSTLQSGYSVHIPKSARKKKSKI